MGNIKEIISEWEIVSDRYYTLSEKVDKIHDNNEKVALELLPRIKNQIVKEIFNKGLCFKGVWLFIENGPKWVSDFYQLNDLGDIIPMDEVNSDTYPGPICNTLQLDYSWVEDRIKDRYFGYYEPRYDLLSSELNINLSIDLLN